MTMGRVLGVDYGTHRVGLALSDPLRIAAHPYEVLDADDDVALRIADVVSENEVDCVVVGLPIGLNGREGPAALEARKLAEAIGAAVSVEVELSDERFTTKTAEEALLKANVSRAKRKKKIDKVAAAVMLQHWLDGR